jgi:hypothetical protein
LRLPERTEDAGGITRKLRMKLALAFGVLLIVGGVILVVSE